MPQLVRMYVRHVAIGFGLAVIFVALLLGLDVGGLRHLTGTSPMGVLAVAMLVVANGIVFAGVQFAHAIMSLGQADDPGGGKRDAVPDATPVPVLSPAAGRRREPRQP